MSKSKSAGGCLHLLAYTVAVFLLLYFINFASSRLNSIFPQDAEPEPRVTLTADSSDERKAEYVAEAVYGGDCLTARAGKYPTFAALYDGTSALIRSNTLRDAVKILKEIRCIRDTIGWEFIDVRIEAHTVLVDAYGNERTGSVLGFNIKAEDIDKINFDNFFQTNVQMLAFNWYEHPAMQK